MRYLGGKGRQGKRIAEIVTRGIAPGSIYVEPFAGAMGSASQVADISVANEIGLCMLLSDVQAGLVQMWRSVVYDGWVPPSAVTFDTYERLKARRDYSDPMTAFVGYGCAFGGKLFGGYARAARGVNDPSHYARPARDSVMRRADLLRKVGADIMCCDYAQYTGTIGGTFYLDPPYVGRTRQSTVQGAFNHADFWAFARILSKDNRVFVSEFVVPDDWVVVHDFGDTVVRHHAGSGSDGTREVLVVHRSRKDLFGSHR